MTSHQNIFASRRRFLNTGFKLAALSAFVLPFQKVLSAGTTIMTSAKKQLYKFISLDKLVLNTKTRVLHLPSGRIFAKYPTIKRQATFGFSNWEVDVKPPYHFHKEKSGIILEMLALTRLATGINDRSLTDAYRVLSIAFSSTYKSKNGIALNKYKFRLHFLLLKVIALNNSYPVTQKWEKFQLATGRINYNLPDKKPLPKYMSWIKNKIEFDKKVGYILKNKQDYTSRLAKRADRNKL